LSDHGDVYSLFVPQSVASDDGYNADNEPLDEENAYIESITDPEVQQELRWRKYFRRLRQGAWGNNIAIAAMCNLFNVSISVLCATQQEQALLEIFTILVMVLMSYVLV